MAVSVVWKRQAGVCNVRCNSEENWGCLYRKKTEGSIVITRKFKEEEKLVVGS